MEKSILDRLKRWDRIYVKWFDADVSSPGWEELPSDKELFCDKLAETCGFYLKHDKNWLIVAFSIDRENKHINVHGRIPVKWIEKIEVFK